MNGTEVDLGVPQYSQEIHHGDFPQYDNGGEAWCSPTSTSMVVAYWTQKTGQTTARRRPSTLGDRGAPSPPHQDPWVDFTAREVYDYHYNGAGNWPFNAAYAASRGLVGDVTQLHNLRRGRAVHQGRHPARRLRRVGLEQARRRRSRAPTATCW